MAVLCQNRLFRLCKFTFNINNASKYRTNNVTFGYTGFKIKDKLHSRQLAQDFIFKLNHKERTILFEELQRFQTQGAAIQVDQVIPEPPSTSQLKAIAAHSAMPFIGFGFLDNLIMILAGDYIDTTIGVTFGISTMAAAGLGNTLSDVAGIGSAFYVERIASKIGVEAPSITPAQASSSRTRWCINLGRALGVTIGCLLGMFPLFFRRNKEADEITDAK
ncbi:transmembrane protein 65 [Parasteatoda tepidariorum]|uniref:transmembrane protein 65 n=1 Tax=Parasteatoda tepidariorum TaxID=114398 RepID=UPI00077F87F5|nr:transmembrane protein 65 [Parasteatoda tepidariorum]XP_015924959.1 transmembrane protein 65 [Parasteatoda tepidariorum]